MAKKKKSKAAARTRGFATTSVLREKVPEEKIEPKVAGTPVPKEGETPRDQVEEPSTTGSAENGEIPNNVEDSTKKSLLSESEIRVAKRALNRKRTVKRLPSLSPHCATLTVPHDTLQMAMDAICSYQEKRENKVASSISKSWIQSCDLNQAYVGLLENYAELQELGFGDSAIVQALEVNGPNLEKALDWLCLNVDECMLPDGWYRENAENVLKPSASVPDRDDSANPSEREGGNTNQEVETIDSKDFAKLSVKESGSSLNSAQEKMSQKDWILKRYEMDSSSDSDEGDYFAEKYGISSNLKKKKESKKKKSKHDLMLEESVEVFSTRVCTIDQLDILGTEKQNLAELMEILVKRSKQSTVDKRSNGLNIKATKQKEKVVRDRIDELNPTVGQEDVEVDADVEEVEAGQEEGGFANMFEEADEGEQSSSSSSPTCEIVDCHVEKWTGLSPVQLLQEFVSKLNGGNGAKQGNLPKYTKRKCSRGGMFRFSVSFFVNGKAETTEMPQTQCCKTKREAQDLVALLALWKLAPDQAMYRRVAPVFRDLWTTWIAAKQEAMRKQEIETIESAHQVVTDILSRVSKAAMDAVEGSSMRQSASAGESEEGGSSRRNDSVGVPERSGWKGTSSETSGNWVANELENRSMNPKSSYVRLSEFKKQLPVAAIRQRIVDELLGTESSDVVIVCGQTGSGKTTQVPQYLLEGEASLGRGNESRIVCTEPRRISAVSVAQRVSEELGDGQCGGRNSLVGYQIKGDRKCNDRTPLVYCTTGVLLRRLQGDSELQGISHLVVDEVHERTVQSDFLLIVLRRILALQRLGRTSRRRPLKVVLMSATVDAEKLSRYFGGVPVIEAGGRTFPVRHFDLADALELTSHQVDPASPYALREDRIGKDRTDVRVNMKRFGGGGMFVSGETIASAAANSAASSSNEVQGNVRMVTRGISEPTSEQLVETGDEKYSPATLNSLGIVDESKVNFDLIEAILEHIDRHDPPNGCTPKKLSSDPQPVRKVGNSSVEEDFKESLKALKEGGKDGEDANVSAILVFMPGMSQIRRLHDQLNGHRVFGDPKRYRVIALHSSLATASTGAQQREVFDPPPKGMRKIVIATNIAETGVTIPDVVYVIDTVRVKELSFDSARRVNKLEEKFVSQANALQRQGRAGRVRPGICFRLVSTELFESLPKYSTPEIQRTSLEDLCLQVLMIHKNSNDNAVDMEERGSYFPPEFLGEALDPPAASAIADSLEHLVNIGAAEVNTQEGVSIGSTMVSSTEPQSSQFEMMPKGPSRASLEPKETLINDHTDSTSDFPWIMNKSSTAAMRLKPLGAHLGAMPLDVQVGKMLIYSCLMSCVDVVLTITASIDQKSPFHDTAASGFGPQGDESNKTIWKKFNRGHSDLITLHNLYVEWRKFVHRQCRMKMENSSLSERTLIPRFEAQFCSKNKLSLSVMRAIHQGRADLAGTLVGIGFLPPDYSTHHFVGQDKPLPPSVAKMNRNSLQDPVVCSVICAGLYPNLSSVRLESAKRGFATGSSAGAAPPISLCTADNIVFREHGVKQLFLRKDSVNFGSGVGPGLSDIARGATEGGGSLSGWKGSTYWNPGNTERRTIFAVYMEKMKTSRTFIHDSTFVPPSGVALFAGGTNSLNVFHHDRRLLVDRWVELQTPPKTAVVFKYIRELFDDVLMDQLRNPAALLAEASDGTSAEQVLQFVADLIVAS